MTKSKTKITDLNLHLFETLERLNDDELTEENLEKEIARADAIAKIGKTVIENGKLMLDAQKHADDYGYSTEKKKLPSMLSIGRDKDE